MSKGSEELLKGRNDQINYAAVIKQFPWIVEEGHSCVLSPDSDGLLCGLLMAKYKKWKICGFYDDKVALINRRVLSENPIFLDGEIFRRGIRSMGHHMLTLNHKRRPNNYDGCFENCIQPNLMRNYDKNLFQLKYPLATIHMLASILAYSLKDTESPMTIPVSAIPALFFTDGVYSTMFRYTENVLNWLHYLRMDEPWNPLKNIFENEKFTVFDLMKEMNAFFRERDKYDGPRKQTGDKLRISNKKGEPYNIEKIETGTCHIAQDAIKRICDFIRYIGSLTEWPFYDNDWDCWENLQFFQFTKGSFKGDKKTLTISNFNSFIQRNPLSWAMTSGQDIEYTMETPSRFPFNLYRQKTLDAAISQETAKLISSELGLFAAETPAQYDKPREDLNG